MAKARSKTDFRTRPNIGSAIQDHYIRTLFPGFNHQGPRSHGRWVGWLQPNEFAPRFRVRIKYDLYSAPRVHVLEPTLVPNAPHRYSDGSLCLFFPSDGGWGDRSLIATTIIPWIISWLGYYDLWTQTGKWLGPEAPHDGRKRG